MARGDRLVAPLKWLRSRPPGSTRLVRVNLSFRKAKRPTSARQRKLHARARRRKEREGQPPAAAQALRRAMAWQTEMRESGLTRADIARRENLTRARVTQVMSLLNLADNVKTKLLAEDPEVTDWSIRRALREVENTESVCPVQGS